MRNISGIVCLLLCTIVSLTACDDVSLNSPYPAADKKANYLYSAFSSQPKHLDPAKAYSSDEYQFIGQVYEPLLQYHYLKRPYQLEPLTAKVMPEVKYYDKQGKLLANDSPREKIAYSEYLLTIRDDIRYASHPAFAKNAQGEFVYHQLTSTQLQDIQTLQDFEQKTSRHLSVDDYINQIKRLAHPEVNSPILGLMSKQIVGLADLAKELKTQYQAEKKQSGKLHYLDLRKFELAGVKKINEHQFSIRIHGKDPQFIYWLAMPFFSPMPWEADKFYAQEQLLAKNITLDWYPIGTGAYQLVTNDPNKEMVLAKNPYYHQDFYPSEGMFGDQEKGLLADAGKQLPFIDKVIFSLEKESIPRWSKFLQGYYDRSGIGSDNFDQAISFLDGSAAVTDELFNKGISLQTSTSATSMYWGFNMLDSVVGGRTERARLLRQAISIAVDMEEYIAIFLNGRGVAAQSPIPPGIFGFESESKSLNKVVYQWQDLRIQRKPLAQAKKLLTKAGYANGVDQKTGKPLVLHYDVISSGGPDDKARFAWFRKQFAKLNIELDIRATQYNRFRDKMRTGNAQIYSWGWHADYPDPENFMFLLYGPSGKVKHQGENSSNYSNPKFDKLYEKMKDMANTPERLEVLKKMIGILQYDAPWIWGFHPVSYVLSHHWNRIGVTNEMANNSLKYARLDPELRAEFRTAWNVPIFWPLWLLLALIGLSLLPVYWTYYRAEHQCRHKRLSKEDD